MQNSKNKVIILKSSIFEEIPNQQRCIVCGSATKKCGTVAQANLCDNFKPKKTNNESKVQENKS